MTRTRQRQIVAIGPRMPEWGSWDWLGADLAEALRDHFDVRLFDGFDVPKCDVAIVVKHAPTAEIVEALSHRCRVVYAPVDFYGDLSQVDGDHRMLRRCARVVVHSERLRKCLAPYARIEYCDHHVKFVAPAEARDDGELLWVGVRTNVPVLGEWLGRHHLPLPLRVLTNFGDPERPSEPGEIGLPDLDGLVLEHWTPETHRRRVAAARAALDVKGFDFRQWHKPPAKAIDFVASGLPLAMNHEASAVEHLRERYGFEVAEPTDTDRWFSEAYRAETRELGELLRSELSLERVSNRWAKIVEDVLEESPSESSLASVSRRAKIEASPPIRIAVVSLLFEWPTKGGGNVHTYELVQALTRAGYEVRHLFVEYGGWGTGAVRDPLPYDHEVLRFAEGEWSLPNLRGRLKAAVDGFDPDSVILTDSWNAKPILAETLAEYPTILRLQALECICPLNNVRLLPRLEQCDGNQLVDADRCRRCLVEHRSASGSLHAAERGLCAVGSAAYDEVLQRAFRRAEAVLAVNHETAHLVAPFVDRVVVAPSGFDPSRFPWPWPEKNHVEGPTTILFAGHPGEPIKGFSILREACRQLWRERQDFELVVTSDPLPDALPFERFVGWQSQEAVPATLRTADVCVVPSIAQEALGRVAVEAQAVARPVVASRIGGLPTTVADGESGLLFEPGNPADLARQLARLLDEPELRNRLGECGRRRFETEFTWETLVERCYSPLIRQCAARRRGDRPASRLGCVLAIRDREPRALERTLETYESQLEVVSDRVVVDYGSAADRANNYRLLCDRFGWRLIRVDTAGPWSLSDAYNRAVAALHGDVDVVFKSDVDVLLESGVLEVARERGRRALCLFDCFAAHETTLYPTSCADPTTVARLFDSEPCPVPMPGEGLMAFPRNWFEAIGGFDRDFTGWGYEDSDLRRRAALSIGFSRVSSPRLLHQWHPRSVNRVMAERNRRHYEASKSRGSLVRNGGLSLQAEMVHEDGIEAVQCGAAKRLESLEEDNGLPNLLVLTPGHTGSSIVTWMLHQLGWRAPADVDHYAEPVAIRDLNERCLAEGYLDREAARAELARQPTPWAIKDPRFARTMSEWLPLLEPYAPALLFLSRDPERVRESCQQRGETPADGLLDRCRAILDDWPWHRLEIDFDNLGRAIDAFDSSRRGAAGHGVDTTHRSAKGSGRLEPGGDAGPARHETGDDESGADRTWRQRREVVVATRSVNDELYALSGRFLDFDGAKGAVAPPTSRRRFQGRSATDYLQGLAELPARWVVNVDEDALLLDPAALLRLIDHMDREGFAACGLPDGGVVPIRRHNPAACNAFFNVFDLERVRPIWAEPGARRAPFRDEYLDDLPAFTSRHESAPDDFEPYYGLFFALRAAGESILLLDGETWEDGTSTLLHDHEGGPLLLHAWYARAWATDPGTRLRYERLVDSAERLRSHVGKREGVSAR